MTASGNKINLVCRQILDTREVLEGQIVAAVLNNDSVKDLPLEAKKDLSMHIRSNLIQQFNSLIDRTQSILS